MDESKDHESRATITVPTVSTTATTETVIEKIVEGEGVEIDDRISVSEEVMVGEVEEDGGACEGGDVMVEVLGSEVFVDGARRHSGEVGDEGAYVETDNLGGNVVGSGAGGSSRDGGGGGDGDGGKDDDLTVVRETVSGMQQDDSTACRAGDDDVGGVGGSGSGDGGGEKAVDLVVVRETVSGMRHNDSASRGAESPASHETVSGSAGDVAAVERPQDAETHDADEEKVVKAVVVVVGGGVDGGGGSGDGGGVKDDDLAVVHETVSGMRQDDSASCGAENLASNATISGSAGDVAADEKPQDAGAHDVDEEKAVGGERKSGNECGKTDKELAANGTDIYEDLSSHEVQVRSIEIDNCFQRSSVEITPVSVGNKGVSASDNVEAVMEQGKDENTEAVGCSISSESQSKEQVISDEGNEPGISERDALGQGDDPLDQTGNRGNESVDSPNRDDQSRCIESAECCCADVNSLRPQNEVGAADQLQDTTTGSKAADNVVSLVTGKEEAAVIHSENSASENVDPEMLDKQAQASIVEKDSDAEDVSVLHAKTDGLVTTSNMVCQTVNDQQLDIETVKMDEVTVTQSSGEHVLPAASMTSNIHDEAEGNVEFEGFTGGIEHGNDSELKAPIQDKVIVSETPEDSGRDMQTVHDRELTITVEKMSKNDGEVLCPDTKEKPPTSSEIDLSTKTELVMHADLRSTDEFSLSCGKEAVKMDKEVVFEEKDLAPETESLHCVDEKKFNDYDGDPNPSSQDDELDVPLVAIGASNASEVSDQVNMEVDVVDRNPAHSENQKVDEKVKHDDMEKNGNLRLRSQEECPVEGSPFVGMDIDATDAHSERQGMVHEDVQNDFKLNSDMITENQHSEAIVDENPGSIEAVTTPQSLGYAEDIDVQCKSTLDSATLSELVELSSGQSKNVDVLVGPMDSALPDEDETSELKYPVKSAIMEKHVLEAGNKMHKRNENLNVGSPISEGEVPDVSVAGNPAADFHANSKQDGNGESEGHAAREQPPLPDESPVKDVDQGLNCGSEISFSEDLERSTTVVAQVGSNAEQEQSVDTEQAVSVDDISPSEDDTSKLPDRVTPAVLDRHITGAEDIIHVTDEKHNMGSPFLETEVPDISITGGQEADLGADSRQEGNGEAEDIIHEMDVRHNTGSPFLETEVLDVSITGSQQADLGADSRQEGNGEADDIIHEMDEKHNTGSPLLETEVPAVSITGSQEADLVADSRQEGNGEADHIIHEMDEKHNTGSPLLETEVRGVSITGVQEADFGADSRQEGNEEAEDVIHEMDEKHNMGSPSLETEVPGASITGSQEADLGADFREEGNIIHEMNEKHNMGSPSLETEVPGVSITGGQEADLGADSREEGNIMHEMNEEHNMGSPSLEKEVRGASIIGGQEVDLGADSRQEGNGGSEGHSSQEQPPLPDDSIVKGVDQGLEGEPDVSQGECLDKSATDYVAEVGSKVEHMEEMGEQAANNEQVESPEEQELDEEPVSDSAKPRSKGEKNSKRTTSKPGSLIRDHQVSYQLLPEDEGEFSVFDLVWGKVKSHPWWPGQIFHPSDSSEKAMKYYRKDCYLVAYFGDRSFAWNDASVLKPFRNHFSQEVRQSNSDSFQNAVTCALAEFSRRVELGLACSCISEEAYDKIKYQIVENAGIREESSKREGIDRSTGADSFQPDKLIEYIKTLAIYPNSGSDRLDLVIAKAQLLAFNRQKGRGALPDFEYYDGGLAECEADNPLPGPTDRVGSVSGVDGKAIPKAPRKRKHNLKDIVYQRRKEKSLTELMGETMYYLDGEFDSHDEDDLMLTSPTSGTKRKASGYPTDDFTAQHGTKTIALAKVSHTASPNPQQSFKVGDCIRRVASQLTGLPSIIKGGSEGSNNHIGDDADKFVETPNNSVIESTINPSDQASLDEMLSQLHVSARDPMKGYSFLGNIISFFSEFRNLAVSTQRQRMRKAPGRKPKSSFSVDGSPRTFEFDDRNDSYWTDMVVQNNSEAKPSRRGRKRKDEQHLSVDSEKPVQSNRRKYSRKQYFHGNHETAAETPSGDEKKQEELPTELMLSFSDMGSVPSELHLSKMFRRFGPLKESETEVDMQNSRARVVFKKRSDAEVAYSSATMFNIFGSTLVNYQLNYTPSVHLGTSPLKLTAAEGDAT